MMKEVKIFAAAAVLMIAAPAAAADAPAGVGGWKPGPAFDHALPNVPGKSLKAVVVEYAPGGTSPAHTHAKSAFITAIVLR